MPLCRSVKREIARKKIRKKNGSYIGETTFLSGKRGRKTSPKTGRKKKKKHEEERYQLVSGE